jgi:hypothetical protein
MRWSAQDDAVYQLLERELGARIIEVIEHSEEMILTDQTQGEDIDWNGVPAPQMQQAVDQAAQAIQGMNPGAAVDSAPAYPTYPDNPHEHRLVITLKGGTGYDAPWLVVHCNDAAEANAILNEVDSYGVYASIAAAQGRLRAVAPGKPATSGPVGPVTYQAPPGAVAQPEPPPFGPNVSVPQAAGYVGPPPAQQQWQAPPPQQQQGGWQGGGQGGGSAEPKAQPPGWWRVNARSGPGFDAWKAMRDQQKDYVKGKILFAGNGGYWIDPSIGLWLGQQGWAISQ